jgi:hypothetical protein
MGVYHLMGLGRSPGAVVGPLSYLAHRYQRWNAEDQRFFSRSGEASPRERGEKVGEVQALVLFSTKEVITGTVHTNDYILNSPGRVSEGPKEMDRPMKEALRNLLKKDWPKVAGGRQSGTVFWCEVDRRDTRSTYARIAQVVAALAGVGGQGKEMWVNLTGGNNVINFALQLVATLSGAVARLYYVQAENPTAEKCVRFTAENGYWVGLPVMPLALSRITLAVLELLSETGPLSSSDVFGRLHQHQSHWHLFQGVSLDAFREMYLTTMWKQGLIEETREGNVIGRQWKLIRPYEEDLKRAGEAGLTIEELVRQVDWIEREDVPLQ